ncbi:helix-turn-helix transcriptional regulator [Legionella bononiensis]|uniref:Helix-turn-helix transcriptional regulator n=1 Tax=Legionella bononiensis TaxID=2793102 RepID=A0ABS1W7Z9_9GAMM|nr:helix-turn-helix transcriptional regulator [Legionella bononiensis]MBL7480003.1 helix-turn-helix transcriptional regulator [Legionella bononiensis]MBL7525483.1 helix-turn-helix transcriptional regulator [Legionella bononiensis]MBL7561666.1 helix-turn-helix transcriptional regulator [Legionella bononiensis]
MLIPELSLLDHLPGYIGWKDLNRHYLGANKALLELKGFSDLEDFNGKTDEELSPWSIEENELFHQQDLSVLNGKKVSTVHMDSKTGEVYLLEKNPLTDPKNNVTGLIYYCRPCSKDEVFQMLRQYDETLQLSGHHYTLIDHENKYELTNREYECVFLLIRGKSAKEIGTLLSLSKRTVESYIEHIKNKMDCKNKAEILVKAMLSGYHHHIPARLNQATIIKSL